MAAPSYSTGDVPTATEVDNWFVNAICKQKPSNESISSSTTLQNDNDLYFSVETNTIFHVTLVLFVSSQTANDMKIDFTLPAGAAFNYGIATQHTGAAVYADDTIFSGTAGATSPIGGLGGVGTAVAHIEGLCTTAGTAGTFQLQWAQNASGASGTTMLANSFLVARRVG